MVISHCAPAQCKFFTSHQSRVTSREIQLYFSRGRKGSGDLPGLQSRRFGPSRVEWWIRLPHASANSSLIRTPPERRRGSGVWRSVEFVVFALVVRDAKPFKFLFRVQFKEDLVPSVFPACSFCSGLGWRFGRLVTEDIPISHRIADGPHNPRKILLVFGSKNTSARGFREGLKVARPAPFCRSDEVLGGRRRARKRQLRLHSRFLFRPCEDLRKLKRRSRHHCKDRNVSFLQKTLRLPQVITAVIVSAVGNNNHRPVLVLSPLARFGDSQVDAIKKRRAAVRWREQPGKPAFQVFLIAREGNKIFCPRCDSIHRKFVPVPLLLLIGIQNR